MKKNNLLLVLVSLLIVFSIGTSNLVLFAQGDQLNNTNFFESNTASYEPNYNFKNPYNKIHFYIGNIKSKINNKEDLEDAISSVKAKAVTRGAYSVNSVSSINELLVTVQFESDFMATEEFADFSRERATLKTTEEVREFRSRLNAFSKSYHEEVLRNNLCLLSDLECKSVKPISYSPFVSLTMRSDKLQATDLLTIATSEKIETISISLTASLLTYETETTTTSVSWDDVLASMNENNIVKNGVYTGDGVRIGIFEARGNCSTTFGNLPDRSITLKDPSVDEHWHATFVTAIAADIAPDADYYVQVHSQVTTGNENDFDLSWFIENGCDIVNCSMGKPNSANNNDGTYAAATPEYQYNIDGLVDYQIAAHLLVFVVSAGNVNNNSGSNSYNPNGVITSPGLAYNAITVGGVDPVNDGYAHAANACHIATADIVKPNISALYTVKAPNGPKRSGTSFGAPLVTGAVALLLEKNPSYSIYPERIQSLLASTAQKTVDYEETIGGFDEQVGPGIINLSRMLNSSENYFTYYNTADSNAVFEEIARVPIPLQADDKLQLALAWIISYKIEDVPSSENIVTDYDIQLYDPNGNLVLLPYCLGGNIETACVTITQTGVYNVVICQYSQMNSEDPIDYMALTYSIE